MRKELAKTYDPRGIEDRLYQKWEKRKYFHAEVNPDKKPFTIVIPPPNITGRLHMGHALDNTMQDILIRYKRMQGFETLWQPGTDHASIATEVRITDELKKEGIDKQSLGREGFLKRAWEWKREYGGAIIGQLKKLGSSCDWDRERFTMDEGCNRAVTEVFVKMHKKGYIYQGSRIVNWCPVCSTTISDAEVEYEEQKGHLWHIKYPLIEDDGSVSKTRFLVFATTRPETMLGDTAVAVNPEDERYKDLVGKEVLLPIVNRRMPVVADTYVDMEFGTGVVKITPGHDPNDFEVGRRHGLEEINIMNDDATINENGGKYAGQDRYECRKNIVRELDEMGLLVKIEDYTHNVGTHDRCGTTVEPLIKKQWFVRMDELIRPAAEAVKKGEIRLVPPRMDKIYFNWTDNIRDWCISRQLWWGHRIPAWTCDDCGELIVQAETPAVCPKCGGTHLTQDPDTLDTWFSSALWPFETLGWPEKTKDLDYFFPTDVLVTGYDIIFFWVIRMIFSSYEQMGTYPFHTVLFHGLVRDALGRKMSKSLGNGIDPLDIIDRYGADALRLTLITGNSPGNDMRFYNERVENSRNFANKIWNASRFIMMNLDDCSSEQYRLRPCSRRTSVLQSGEVRFNVPSQTQAASSAAAADGSSQERLNPLHTLPAGLEPADRWILSRLNRTIREVTENMEKYELGIAVQKVYDFLWDEFCDWYIEMVKPRLYGSRKKEAGADARPADALPADGDESRAAALWTLQTVLLNALKLLHPFMPFVTEEIYCTLLGTDEKAGEDSADALPEDAGSGAACALADDTGKNPEFAESIMISAWPRYRAEWEFLQDEKEIGTIREAVRGIRNVRTQMNVAPSRKARVYIVSEHEETLDIFRRGRLFFESLAAASDSVCQKDKSGIADDAASVMLADAALYMPFADLVDTNAEIARLTAEKERLEKELARSKAMLSNEKFLAKAPAAKIEEEKEKQVKYAQTYAQVTERLAQLTK